MGLICTSQVFAAAPVIAIVDTGIAGNQLAYPQLQVVGGYDFVSHPIASADGNGRDSDATDPGDGVDERFISRNPTLCQGYTPHPDTWHGSRVVSLVDELLGPAHNTRFVNVRVSGRCGVRLADMIDAIRWSVGIHVPGVPMNFFPAKIVLLSLAGSASCPKRLQQAIDEANALGAVLIAAAGNDGKKVGRVGAPAACKHIIVAGELAPSGMKSRNSSLGPEVDVMVNSQRWEGTSFSAAALAAWVSPIIDQAPNMSSEAVRNLIHRSAQLFSIQAPELVTCTMPLSQSECACTKASGVCGAGVLTVRAPLF